MSDNLPSPPSWAVEYLTAVMPILLARLNVPDADCIEIVIPQIDVAEPSFDTWQEKARLAPREALAVFMLTYFEPFTTEWRKQGVTREEWVINENERFMPILGEIYEGLEIDLGYDFLSPPAHPDSD